MEAIRIQLRHALNRGAFLEELVENVLQDQEFVNVNRQKSGAQYGFDIIAERQGKYKQVWKFECKNLSEALTIDDIAPKLIWHIGSEPIDRFVIVSLSKPTDYVHELLSQVKFPFPIEIWCEDFLMTQIKNSPRACQRLGIEQQLDKSRLEPIVYEPNLLLFDAICTEKNPYSFDYFRTEKGLTKAYTEEWINLVAGFCNNSKHETFICTEINVITLYYTEVTGRVLRQAKMKGLVKPAKLKFAPSPVNLKEVHLLDANTILEVKPDKDEFLILELDKAEVKPGHYEIIFEAKGRLNKRDTRMYSTVFSLHVAHKDADILRLHTVGKFYDSPVDEILNVDSKIWNAIKQIDEDRIAYLGPTFLDFQNQESKDDTWKVRTVKGFRENDSDQFVLHVPANSHSEILCDLGIPIKEKILHREDIYKNFLGNNWKDILGLK